MAKKPEPTEEENKYLRQFREHMEEIDEVAQSVLKGHLILEGALDNIIGLIFFHPELVFGSRITFYQKVQMVRAYALQEQDFPMWKLVFAINELRNEIAHRLEGERRKQKLAALRDVYFAEAGEKFAYQKDYADNLIVMLACSHCTGFLGRTEEDIGFLREQINAIAAMAPKKDGRTR